MNQTKLESALEISLNYLSGFILAYLTYKFLVLPIESLRTQPAAVTGIFTIVSIARSYIWRRLFNGGVHKAVHRVVTAWIKS